MYVLMEVGGRAGEVLDVAPEAARELIASGQATNPYGFVEESEIEKPEKKHKLKK